jgi:hypothetical protein
LNNIASLEADFFRDKMIQIHKGKFRLEIFIPHVTNEWQPTFKRLFLTRVKVFEYVKINTFAESFPCILKFWNSHFR